MICKACAQGADRLSKKVSKGSIAVAKSLHAKCKGCDCQHRVDLQVEGRSIRE